MANKDSRGKSLYVEHCMLMEESLLSFAARKFLPNLDLNQNGTSRRKKY